MLGPTAELGAAWEVLRSEDPCPALYAGTKPLPVPTAWNPRGRRSSVPISALKWYPQGWERLIVPSYLHPSINLADVFSSPIKPLVNRRWCVCVCVFPEKGLVWSWCLSSVWGGWRGERHEEGSLMHRREDGKVPQISNSFQFPPGSTLPVQLICWNQAFPLLILCKLYTALNSCSTSTETKVS